MNFSTIRRGSITSIGVLIIISFALNLSISKSGNIHDEYVPPQLSHFQYAKTKSTVDKEASLNLRRTLSDSPTSTSGKAVVIDGSASSPPSAPKANTHKDQRPSGVVYEYIEPPPLNLMARSQKLQYQFTYLADLSSSKTALCAIVKDSEPYIDEWIDYHFGLGFHTIYLIDNSDKHELLSWQNKRRAAGYSVRVIPKPGSHRQMYGYHICASEFKEVHTYMAFFDVDEFLVLKNHTNVDDFLDKYLPKGALAISWYIFGSANTTMYSPIPVTKRFMFRDGISEMDRHPKWDNVKSIVKLKDYGQFPQSPHSMKTNKKTAGSNKAWMDTNGGGSFDEIGARNIDRPLDVAVLHHYKYLSPKEFYWKTCIRKTVDDLYKDCDNKTKNMISQYVGSVYDDSAWQTLKRNVPKYAMYDEFEDFMQAEK